MKTKKSISKRVKVTATGKLLHKGRGTNHLRGAKSPGQLRKMKKYKQLTGQDAKNFKKLLPYA